MPACFLWATNRAVINQSDGRIYRDLDTVPVTPVGLVLGTSPSYQGAKNLFFERRMDAAAEVYHAGKVKKLLVSGDNGTPYYNEPMAMSKALVARSVPEKDIVMDCAGFRTLDSVVRARTAFGLTRCTIVTDDFHLPRALYIAAQENLDAVGFQTKPLPRSIAPWTYIREIGSRSLVWVDINILHTRPKFTGPREPIQLALDPANRP